MGAEDFNRGVVSVLLVSALVFSMILVTPFASSGDWVNYPEPGGTTIEVAQGGTFLIKYVLEWNEPENGAYAITMAWYCYGDKPEENLTFENASAYFTSDNSSIAAKTTLESTPGENTIYALTVECPTDQKESRDEQFNVDIVMGAYGVGGVPHIPGDHMILASPYGVMVIESGMDTWGVASITIRVGELAPVCGVEVSISPENQENAPGTRLDYTVTVKNTGNVDDNYDLTWSDNARWGDNIQLDNTLAVPASENCTTTLHVHIPDNAILGTEDNITVTATSQVYPAVTDSASCVTCVVIDIGGVDVHLPQLKSGAPGDTLSYTVWVINTGGITDNYDLENSDTAGWDLSLSETKVGPLSPNAFKTVTLSVTIPADAENNDEDVITVTATSEENSEVENSASCVARCITIPPPPPSPGVSVSISDDQSGLPKATLTYTVTVRNTGNVGDTYDLTVTDPRAWGATVPPTSLTIAADGSDTATLSVTIPEGTAGGTEDEITVTATSRMDSTVSDSGSCTAQVTPIRRVEVSISPENHSGPPGETLTYTVTVTNTGNVEDNYDLTADDNANWTLTLPETLMDVNPGENRTVNLSVGIPDNAENSTWDNVTITATSWTDNTVENSASCTAHAVVGPPEHSVQVLISPEDQRGSPKETLTFTVTVKNTGEAEDNYDLTASDYAGWGATLAQNLLTIPAGGNRTTTVSVTVPSDAAEDELTHITVIATSRADPTVSDSVTSRAIAEGAPEGLEVELVLLATSAFLIGAAILVIAYLLRGRRKKAARRGVLGGVSWGFR